MDDIDRFLREDLGPLGTPAGDATSRAVAAGVDAHATVRTRRSCILAGLDEAQEVFRRLGVTVKPLRPEGVTLRDDEAVLELFGAADRILAGERLALNFLMRMSGIATLTHRLSETVHAVNPKCEIAATRKTTPGFRAYEKRAVVLGGGSPHRQGLYDAILIKENHKALAGGIEEAVARCRKNAPGERVEVEAETLDEALEAVAHGAEEILLDNFTPQDAREAFDAVRAKDRKIVVEVSGGITPDNILEYAFADRVSLGYLTHSATAADFALDIQPS